MDMLMGETTKASGGFTINRVLKEFKEFALKGNVMDIAVGVIVGGAFSKIVTSLVTDIVTPVLSALTSNVHIKDLSFAVETSSSASAPIQIPYGHFLQSIIDFLIVTFFLFVTIKLINKLKKKQADMPLTHVTSPEEELLTEIRDMLKTLTR